jgi:hypothetical protein
MAEKERVNSLAQLYGSLLGTQGGMFGSAASAAGGGGGGGGGNFLQEIYDFLT